MKFVLLFLVVAYGAFAFSSYGFLTKSAKEPGALKDKLVCTYFTGLGFATKEYWYAENDLLGRSLCPRTIYFGENHAPQN
jgi:hypothetical protein